MDKEFILDYRKNKRLKKNKRFMPKYIYLKNNVELICDEEDYDKYAAKIRKEYSWVPDDQYRIGRKKVLQDFLNRPRIYFTERAGKELEQQARVNIEREIARLS